MTWQRALLSLACILLSLVIPSPPLTRTLDTLVLPRNTTRMDLNGWSPTHAVHSAPQGRPFQWMLLREPRNSATWIAPLIPRRNTLCSPGWDQNASHAAGRFLSAGTINWWPCWRKPMPKRGMMLCTAPHWVPLRTRPPLSPTPLKMQPSRGHWICMPWTSNLILGYGPGIGSPRRRLDDFHDCERAARSGTGDAFSTRLPQRMPVRAEPGPKSGPCFCVPCPHTSCQARGARVAGYPASGPAEAAYSALCQLAHSSAKPRGSLLLHSAYLQPYPVALATVPISLSLKSSLFYLAGHAQASFVHGWCLSPPLLGADYPLLLTYPVSLATGQPRANACASTRSSWLNARSGSTHILPCDRNWWPINAYRNGGSLSIASHSNPPNVSPVVVPTELPMPPWTLAHLEPMMPEPLHRLNIPRSLPMSALNPRFCAQNATNPLPILIFPNILLDLSFVFRFGLGFRDTSFGSASLGSEIGCKCAPTALHHHAQPFSVGSIILSPRPLALCLRSPHATYSI